MLNIKGNAGQASDLCQQQPKKVWILTTWPPSCVKVSAAANAASTYGNKKSTQRAQTSAKQLTSPHTVSYALNNLVHVHVEGAGVPGSALPLMEAVDLKITFQINQCQ